MKKIILTTILFLLSFQGISQGFDKPRYQIVTQRAGTYLGTLEIELFPLIAPLATRNFDSLVSVQAFDSTAFHRVVPGFVIQGGDPNSINGPISTWGQGNASQPTVNAEFSAVQHLRGRMGAARDVDTNSATSQFYFCVANALSLDGNYTVFGQVTNGIGLVDTIVNSPRNANDVPLQKIEMFITAIGVNNSVPATPVLISPADNASGITNSTSFQWSVIGDAVQYKIEFSSDSLFSSIIYWRNAGTASTTMPLLQNASHYYWRVKANNGGHESGYSNVHQFVTVTSAPILISPPNTATNIVTNPVFEWAPVIMANSYQLQVSNAGVFNASTIVYDQSGIMDTMQQVTGLNTNTQYWWRMRSANGTSNSLFSPKFTFTTGTSAGVNDKLQFNLISCYPNPVKNILSINAHIYKPGKVILSINNAEGKMVYQEQMNVTQQQFIHTINMSKLTKGIYFLTMNVNGATAVRKLEVD